MGFCYNLKHMYPNSWHSTWLCKQGTNVLFTLPREASTGGTTLGPRIQLDSKSRLLFCPMNPSLLTPSPWGRVFSAPSPHCPVGALTMPVPPRGQGTPDPPVLPARLQPAKAAPTGLPAVQQSWPSQDSARLDSPCATGHIQHPTATMLAQQPKQPRLVLCGAAAGVPDVQLPHTCGLPVRILVREPFCRHPQGAGTVNAVHHPDLRLALRPRAWLL